MFLLLEAYIDTDALWNPRKRIFNIKFIRLFFGLLCPWVHIYNIYYPWMNQSKEESYNKLVVTLYGVHS